MSVVRKRVKPAPARELFAKAFKDNYLSAWEPKQARWRRPECPDWVWELVSTSVDPNKSLLHGLKKKRKTKRKVRKK